MARYLVTARPNEERLDRLLELLRKRAFEPLRPFGQSLTYSLTNARIREDGFALWEEEDYCTPPLAQEREAVLDEYFEDLTVTPVGLGKGWEKIKKLPRLFPELVD
ncbi:hypothetical protein MYX76_15535 [Desulfobacterota bacterium AH_259_B03_O07]|nr:hypothetical protein [Desulfobacterota bacterium AH_259_B03_O07]